MAVVVPLLGEVEAETAADSTEAEAREVVGARDEGSRPASISSQSFCNWGMAPHEAGQGSFPRFTHSVMALT